MDVARIASIRFRDRVVYFDTVFDNDMKAIFNGHRQEVMEWLGRNTEAHIYNVCVGETGRLISVLEYLYPYPESCKHHPNRKWELDGFAWVCSGCVLED